MIFNKEYHMIVAMVRETLISICGRSVRCLHVITARGEAVTLWFHNNRLYLFLFNLLEEKVIAAVTYMTT